MDEQELDGRMLKVNLANAKPQVEAVATVEEEATEEVVVMATEPSLVDVAILCGVSRSCS